MDSSISQGQPQNQQDEVTSPPNINNNLENCPICHKNASSNNIKCVACNSPFHPDCVEMTCSSDAWYCSECAINLPPMSPMSVSDQDIRVLDVPGNVNTKIQLELQRLAEEKLLELKFLRKKYQILEQNQDHQAVSSHSLTQTHPITQQSSKPAISATAISNTNVSNANRPNEPPILQQQSHHVPSNRIKDNITSNSIYTTATKPAVISTYTNFNNRSHEINDSSTQNYTFNNPNNLFNDYNNTAQQNSYRLPNQQPFYTASNIVTDTLANSFQKILTPGQISARQTVPKELPIFSGNPEEWPLFISTYDWSTSVCGLTDAENLVRLQRALRGEALRSVQHILLHPACIPAVISTLKLLFGQPEKILNSIRNKIKLLPVVNTKRLDSITTFAVEVRGLKTIIEASGLHEELNNSSLLQEIILKLSPDLQLSWGMYKTKLMKENKKTNLSTLADWLFDVGVSANCVNITNNIPSTTTEQIPQNRRRDAHIYSHTKQNQHTCLVCNNTCKSVSNCKKFLTADRNERWNMIREHKLCKLCLRKHSGYCKSNIVCGIENCNIKHNALLHKTKNVSTEHERADKNKDNENKMHNVNIQRDIFNQVLFKILPVTIFGQNSKSIKTYAFIDEGSSVSLVNEKLIADLNLRGEVEPLCLRWTNNMQRKEESSQKLSVQLSGPNNKKHFIEVRSVKHLSLPLQSINFTDLSKEFSHLKGLPIESYKNANPQILIGLNNISLCTPNRIKEGCKTEPIAMSTRLGWVLCGNVHNDIYKEDFNCVQICECNDSNLNNLVKQFYAIDSLGINGNQQSYGADEQRAINLLSKYTIQRPDGRYEAPLLWCSNNVHLPESYIMAKRRLICLEKTLQINSELKKTFNETIAKYLDKNYITKLSDKNYNKDRIWYLPIFPVVNKNKPNKTRIVWDAAAKSHGTSLNSMLLKGPDLLASLPSILYKFRQKQIAFSADIEEMFHRVYIREEDRHAQRFLWRSCDHTREPDVYTMNVMTFGAACSPCTSQYVKNINAAKFKNTHPEATEAIEKNHYVDDFLFSTDTPEKAIKLANEVHHIHSLAGFNIRNWVSNNDVVLKNMNEKKSNGKSLTIGDEQSSEKVLGIFWNSSDDEITFKISQSIIRNELLSGNKEPTKREILKILMSVYDPLGLLGHFLMHLKITLQEIWRSGVGWDEPILTPQVKKWEKWLSILPQIKDIEIPRCYLKNISDYSNAAVELHTFVDASENGYAAVAYFRIRSGKNVMISLIGSKTRVAPLKLVSIPRLELMAALIGSRFSKSIMEGHTIQIKKRVFWSDSRTVLSWIRSDHRKYHQFVGVRVSEILDLTEIKEWRWIPGKINIADEATKWTKDCDLSKHSTWFNGPDFLKLSEDSWPADKTDLVCTDIEIKHTNLAIDVLPSFINIQRFSRWLRLLRSVAYVIKFCSFIKRKTRKIDLIKEITQEELKLAEEAIIKETQSQHYLNEINSLKNEKKIPRSSPIYKLSPFLDNNQVLRVLGRIDNANIPEDFKNPIILPKYSYLTKLLILYYHDKYYHSNHETCINELRQKYYIPQIRTVFKSVRKLCQTCKITNAEPQTPQMARLPRARLSAYVAPFTFTGLDYFGPISVVVNRHKEKRYGAIFTCLTIRAIHIEIVHSLTTSSCIMAIRNFACRRGTPREFFSDNGTNFVGADRELREAIKEVDTNALVRNFTTSTTKWNFNPPSAPHMGGAWERMIRSVKSVLYKISAGRCPNDEVLRSMMAEVENIINSRPLTYIPIECENMEALTPNHFLLGTSSGLKPLAMYEDSGAVLRQSYLASQLFAEEFWKRWLTEFLPTLTCRSKWHDKVKPLEVGDLVIVVDPMNPRNVWPRGKVIHVSKADDGQVRRAKVITKCGILERPVVKLALLDVAQKQE